MSAGEGGVDDSLPACPSAPPPVGPGGTGGLVADSAQALDAT